jgi:NADH:ubiquinone oxidoreductase subunit E
VKLIEALGSLRKNKEWSTLKEELFDDALDTLDRKQATEAEKSNIDLPTLYRIQGQKAWVRRYDFDYLTEMYRLELANIRKQLNPSAPGV